MRSLTRTLSDIWINYPINQRYNKTVEYVLTEITQWKVVVDDSESDEIVFEPKEFKGGQTSKYFGVMLKRIPSTDSWDLKFGNLNSNSDQEVYKYDKKDPYKKQKALFLFEVLNVHIANLLKAGSIHKLTFTPFDEDGLGSERLSYFQNMYDKVNIDGEFEWNKYEEGYSIIYKSKHE